MLDQNPILKPETLLLCRTAGKRIVSAAIWTGMTVLVFAILFGLAYGEDRLHVCRLQAAVLLSLHPYETALNFMACRFRRICHFLCDGRHIRNGAALYIG